MDINDITLELKQHLNLLQELYENNNPPENMRDKKFFYKMKEETEPIYELLNHWETLALECIKQNKNVGVHPQQIISTKENMELLIMHSYYHDCRHRRYMELNYSIHYILDQLQRELMKIRKDV